MDVRSFIAGMVAALVLAGCGGGGSAPAAGTTFTVGTAPTAFQRGALITSNNVATLTTSAINSNAAAIGLLATAGESRCDVTMVTLNYQTTGVRLNEATNATGVLLIPSGAACSVGPYPLLAYARATEVLKTRSLSSAPIDQETFLLAAIYAAQGYVVVATDYLGYAGSAYPFHPYLHADTEASTVIDSIRAARAAVTSRGIVLSGRVMLAGYSQGAHASMAAQRAIERENVPEINLVAAGHMSGPYNLSETIIDSVVEPIAGGQFILPFAITAWQKVYGNLYTRPADVFLDPYAAQIESLFPGSHTFENLLQTGRLPIDANYLPTLFRPAYLQDVVNNPNNSTIIAARRNDLLGWNPGARTALCGGSRDPTFSFSTNTIAAQGDFAARGILVSAIDVDLLIQAAAGRAGQPVDMGAYHGRTVPPLCMTALRDQVFNPLR